MSMLDHIEQHLRRGQCPYCTQGYVTYLNKSNVFVCNSCKRQIRMEVRENG